MSGLTQRELESYLWGAATLLRGLIDASDYKQYIFPLLFFKRLSDVWDGDYQDALDETGDEGYATAGVVASVVLDRRFGLAQGFDVFDDDPSEMLRETAINDPSRRAPAVTRAALAAVDALDRSRPFFLFVHYFDAHSPYDAPQNAFTPPDDSASASTSGCLTRAQVAAARLVYSSVVNARTGRVIPGLERSSELGWSDLGWTESARNTALEHARNILFQDPSWSVSQFDAERDIVRAYEEDAGTLNAIDPNLRPFLERGGKFVVPLPTPSVVGA